MSAARDLAVGTLRREPFGAMPDGRAVERVTLAGAGGFAVSLISYGAAVQAILAPGADGSLADVVLGHDDLAGYLSTRSFFGATIGRVANRIAGGRFRLDGADVSIEPNDGPNALHGGAQGFDAQLWEIAATGEGDAPFVTFRRASPDGEGGFPGRIEIAVTYRIENGSTLAFEVEATSDAPTVLNVTNHSFFNLGGVERPEPVYRHHLTLAADRFTPVNAAAIPEPGPPSPVEGTPFDFREATAIGARIRAAHPQLGAPGRGYDHNFVLADAARTEPAFAARLLDPWSGRSMELWTDRPGVQFYSGNFLDGGVRGKYGLAYRQADGLCLEPQDWPDAPNRPDFPSIRLDPGQTYRQRSLFRFMNGAEGAHRDIDTP